MPVTDSGFMLRSLEFLATFFIFFVGLCVLDMIVVYVLDVTQTKHALRRNYPVIGHFRYFFHEVGVIAHSCGVSEPRQLRRFHARIVTENRHSVSLQDMYATHATQSKQNETNR